MLVKQLFYGYIADKFQIYSQNFHRYNLIYY